MGGTFGSKVSNVVTTHDYDLIKSEVNKIKALLAFLLCHING